MGKNIMFGKEDYQKLMDTLGILDDDRDDGDDIDYFNAWNFGQTERDYEFSTTSSLPV